MSENANANNELVLRCQWEAYMECGAGEAKKYHLVGEGFTTFPEAKNPKEYTRKYVNNKTEKTDVIGYSPSISYSVDYITNEPCVQEVVEIHEKEYVGTATHRNIVSVNCWDEKSDGEYAATKRTFAIIPSNKGDGTDALIYTGTMKAVSDIEHGTFNRETKAFTPLAAE